MAGAREAQADTDALFLDWLAGAGCSGWTDPYACNMRFCRSHALCSMQACKRLSIALFQTLVQ